MALTPGSYTNTNLTVNEAGRLTEASSGGGGGGAVSSVFGRTGAVVAVPGDYPASSITNTPSGNISATNTQAAINELDGDKQPIDPTLTALSSYNTNGLLTQTAPDTFTGRTLTGTPGNVSVLNGDGVSGNPTLDLVNTSVAPGTYALATVIVDEKGRITGASEGSVSGVPVVGSAIIDFGAFPGKSDASVVVTGQAGILPGSTVQAWLKLADSADHSADEHMLETLKVFAGNIVAATGFTIYAVNDDKNIGGPPPPTTRIKGYGGGDTRIYGAWNVSWMWS